MQDCKPVKVFIPIGRKLYANECLKSQEEIEYIAHIPYANEVGSIMYAMVNTRLDIDHVVGVLRRYMSTIGKQN